MKFNENTKEKKDMPKTKDRFSNLITQFNHGQIKKGAIFEKISKKMSLKITNNESRFKTQKIIIDMNF